MIVFSNSVLLFSHQKCFSPTLKNLYCIIANGGCINKNAANAMFIPLQRTPAELYPGIDLTPYTDKLAAIKGVISANLQLIAEKKNDPSKVVAIEDVAPMLDELAAIIEGFNKLIRENNAVLDEKPRKQAECKTAVWEHIAFMLLFLHRLYSFHYRTPIEAPV